MELILASSPIAAGELEHLYSEKYLDLETSKDGKSTTVLIKMHKWLLSLKLKNVSLFLI